MTPRNPREISTEGLMIEHYLITLRQFELMAMRDNSSHLSMCVRKSQIVDELHHRELLKRRAI